MSQESKRHHYLPQFYLRQWARSPDNTLWRYTRVPSGEIHEKQVVPKGTGFVDKLYSATDGITQDQRSDSIEREFFSPLDNEAARVHQKLVSVPSETLSREERIAWAKFLSSLLERDPLTLQTNDLRAGQIADEVVEESLARCSPEDRALYTEALTAEVKNATVRSIVRHRMVSEIRDPSFLEHLVSMEWRIITLGDNLDLITSDLPLVVNGARERNYPVHTVAIALNPKLLLLCHPRGWSLDQEAIKITALGYNVALILGAGEFLYSHTRLEDGPLFRLRTMVENAFRRSPPNPGVETAVEETTTVGELVDVAQASDT